ncbi:MAG: ribosome-binding factor A [Firmicutes bacterium]|nr:ribosome-binding factor A [Bacillota bacterium]MCL2256122.1 ribosome-binding factor A [Bacillota bacterium]
MKISIKELNEKIKASIQKTLATELKNHNKISIADVECAENLKTAKVFFGIGGGYDVDARNAFVTTDNAKVFRKALKEDLKDIVELIPKISFVAACW